MCSSGGQSSDGDGEVYDGNSVLYDGNGNSGNKMVRLWAMRWQMLGSAQWQHSHGRSNHAKLEKARRRDDILTGAVVVGATRRNTCQYMPLS